MSGLFLFFSLAYDRNAPEAFHLTFACLDVFVAAITHERDGTLFGFCHPSPHVFLCGLYGCF